MIARLNPAQAAAAFVAFAAAVSAQYTTPVSQADIALVEAQWEAVGLDASIQGGQSLGEPLSAQGLLRVEYGDTTVVPGQAYPAGQLAASPGLTVFPSASANFSSADTYTLALVDFSSISDPDPQGEYRHFLANGVTVNENGSLHVVDGTRVTNYAAPGPLPGTGPHRYAWLLFIQPDDFKAPANLSTAGVAPGHWDFKAYVAQTGLGSPIAASFFTVESGAPTVAAASTSAVNTATLVVSSASSAAATTARAAATSVTSKASSGVAAAGAAATSASSTGAASSIFAPAAGVLAAVAGLVTLLA